MEAIHKQKTVIFIYKYCNQLMPQYFYLKIFNNVWGQTDCILVPAFLCMAIDWIIRHVSSTNSITVGGKTFADPTHANDAALFTPQQSDAIDVLASFDSSAAVLGMHI